MTHNGIVRRFDGELGYGYIVPDDGTPDVFVHFTALDIAGISSLGEGQRVAFQPVREGGITRATNLRLAGNK